MDALILDGALRQGLVAAQTLGRVGFSVAMAERTGCTVPAFSSRYVRFRAALPHVAEEPERFTSELTELLTHHPCEVTLAGSDDTIEALRAARPCLERRTRLALAAEPGLGVAVDKRHTLRAAGSVGVPAPRSVIVAHPDEVAAAVSSVGLPAVAKPAQSWSATVRGASRLHCLPVGSAGEGELIVAYMLSEGVSSVLIQEWLPGVREAVTVMRASGQVRALFAQRTLRTDPPLGGSSITRESIPAPADLSSHAMALLDELGLDGASEVEFRRDRHGRAVLMEVNPRLSASVELAVRAGVPFPLLLFQWAKGDEVTAVTTYRTGMRMRWLGGDLSWLRAAWRHQGEPDIPPRASAARAFVGDFLHRSGYDYLVRDDLRPAVVAANGFVVSRARRATRRLGGRSEQHRRPKERTVDPRR
jgi:predicted ATP-grasp superfamily ATP-dependent carboligase